MTASDARNRGDGPRSPPPRDIFSPVRCLAREHSSHLLPSIGLRTVPYYGYGRMFNGHKTGLSTTPYPYRIRACEKVKRVRVFSRAKTRRLGLKSTITSVLPSSSISSLCRGTHFDANSAQQCTWVPQHSTLFVLSYVAF